MISTRYHLFTVISIFLSLGIGILLGGSLGQHWLSEKQQTLVSQLEDHYDRQLQKNRKLQADYQKIERAFQEEKHKMDDFLRLTVGDSLSNRYFIVFSADKARASRLQKMIQWAGGQAQILESFTYFPTDADGIILLGDGLMDRIDADVLKDIQLQYHAPVVVHSGEASVDWQFPGIYHFEGSLSEALGEYRFLKYLGKVIPPYKEEKVRYGA